MLCAPYEPVGSSPLSVTSGPAWNRPEATLSNAGMRRLMESSTLERADRPHLQPAAATREHFLASETGPGRATHRV